MLIDSSAGLWMHSHSQVHGSYMMLIWVHGFHTLGYFMVISTHPLAGN